MIDKEKILAGRKAVDAYREAHSKLGHYLHRGRIMPIDHSEITDNLSSELKALGFNSLEEFMEANKIANFEALQAWTVFEGECDFCIGRERACLPDCYAGQSEPLEPGDDQTPTGRKRPRIDVKPEWSTISYWQDYYREKFNAEVGSIFPIFPGCSINRRVVAKPELDFFWR